METLAVSHTRWQSDYQRARRLTSTDDPSRRFTAQNAVDDAVSTYYNAIKLRTIERKMSDAAIVSRDATEMFVSRTFNFNFNFREERINMSDTNAPIMCI